MLRKGLVTDETLFGRRQKEILWDGGGEGASNIECGRPSRLIDVLDPGVVSLGGWCRSGSAFFGGFGGEGGGPCRLAAS